VTSKNNKTRFCRPAAKFSIQRLRYRAEGGQKAPPACRKSLAEFVDANDRTFAGFTMAGVRVATQAVLPPDLLR
jgi:hypothetical protein